MEEKDKKLTFENKLLIFKIITLFFVALTLISFFATASIKAIDTSNFNDEISQILVQPNLYYEESIVPSIFMFILASIIFLLMVFLILSFRYLNFENVAFTILIPILTLIFIGLYFWYVEGILYYANNPSPPIFSSLNISIVEKYTPNDITMLCISFVGIIPSAIYSSFVYVKSMSSDSQFDVI